MQIKRTDDTVSLSEFKINPTKIVNRSKATHQPVLLTVEGQGIAVVQAVDEYKKNQEEREFMKAIAHGLMEIKQGNELELDMVKEKLGID